MSVISVELESIAQIALEKLIKRRHCTLLELEPQITKTYQNGRGKRPPYDEEPESNREMEKLYQRLTKSHFDEEGQFYSFAFADLLSLAGLAKASPFTEEYGHENEIYVDPWAFTAMAATVIELSVSMPDLLTDCRRLIKILGLEWSVKAVQNDPDYSDFSAVYKYPDTARQMQAYQEFATVYEGEEMYDFLDAVAMGVHSEIVAIEGAGHDSHKSTIDVPQGHLRLISDILAEFHYPARARSTKC